MPLTEAQQKLIEENRRKAIAKRQSKVAQLSSNQNVAGPSANPINNSTTPSNFYSRTPTSKKFTSKGNTPDISSKFSKALSSSSPKTSFNNTRPQVSFELVSRHQFMVDAPFSAPMIEIFKKIPSRMYDAAKRKWLFAIKDHKLLLQNLDPLLSAFEIHPLPNFVLQIFRYLKPLLLVNQRIKDSHCRNAPTERRIPEVDLSNIDPKLFKALLPFQRQSIYFGVSLKGRLLIADDMGLGKTLQALALAHYYLEDWPLLIVTPSSMKYSWNEAIQVWLPSVPLHHIQVTSLTIS